MGDVVELKPSLKAVAPTAAPDAPVVIPIRRGLLAVRCFHASVLVDARARKVTCEKCKADLDPIDALDGFAQTGDGLAFMQCELTRLQRERHDLKEEVVALRAERNRLKKAIGKANDSA